MIQHHFGFFFLAVCWHGFAVEVLGKDGCVMLDVIGTENAKLGYEFVAEFIDDIGAGTMMVEVDGC